MLGRPNTDWDKLYTSIADAIDLSDVGIRILVLGPSLDDDGPASVLRRYIIQKCNDAQFIVVLTEYAQMQELFEKLWGPVNDLCKAEFCLAYEKDKNTGHNIIDGIIILPNSAGSFIELGMFVIEEEIHNKMLVLFNKDHETTITDSFVGKGAKMALDNAQRATTKLMDYQDFDSTWSEVSKFLTWVRYNKKWHTWKRTKSHG